MRAAARHMLHLTAAIYSARKAVRRPALEEVSARFSPMMADLVSRCWEDEPELRPAGDAVVTLLNWRGKPLPQLRLNVSGLGFTPSKVESVLHGALTRTSDGEGLTVSLPLESADFLLLHK